ncbi:hypothetical protein VCRA2119O147_1600011 [Vibrio crassostreae]|nr:hypothetical protein VCHA43P273_330051 [Vibrio chagasii]CAK1939965.1 hypothetical protein VCRA2117O39_240085 [Vibrio crassostreae]CAK1952714.1 hypothetical protein VCRA2116O30_240085 [Vibrio crassostreae]CAK1955061.1 hypothetical protein VCRA2119O45_250086 [Vibrio crassostreae]CAK1964837.1 hypothetical protein VCRA2117O37_270061 [Vibrio crassostreae]
MREGSQMGRFKGSRVNMPKGQPSSTSTKMYVAQRESTSPLREALLATRLTSLDITF